jgi:beta-lactamase class A
MLLRRFRTLLLVLAALVSSLALLAGCSRGGPPAPASSSRPAVAARTVPGRPSAGQLASAFARLETRFHAHLGVYVLDTGTGRTVSFQSGRRFAFCSTYKALATGVLLMRGAPLSQVIRYRASDLVDYSPITSQHVGTGMTLAAVMAAALEYSDNTAANLLLAQLGGPHQLQQDLRGIGDQTTNSDRNEPSVNTATPGDPRDTSTAQALGTDLDRFVLGHLLSPGRRALMTSWLRHNTTGGPYIRAGVPAGWTVGDKTGNGDWGTRNDIAIAWPPHGAPVVISVLSSRGSADATSDDALIADATRTALAGLR